MATIAFYTDEFQVENLNGSGLGFYGSAFGTSVDVGSFNETTFITDANGTTEGPQVNNIRWTHAESGVINSAGTGVNLTQIPNYLSTLNIRFTHTSAVKTQNAVVKIYDRTTTTNAASGVTTYVAELIHPDTVQNDNGSGDTEWINATSGTSSVAINLVDSPGYSGERESGANTYSDQHDYYLAISASPDSIGSKTDYGLYVELEYL